MLGEDVTNWLKRSRRIWLKKPKKQTIPVVINLLRERFPYAYPYEYSYGSPYMGTSEDKYSYGAGKGKIRMDPEKTVGLSLEDLLAESRT